MRITRRTRRITKRTALSPEVSARNAEVAVEKAAVEVVLTNDKCRASKFALAAKTYIDRIMRLKVGLQPSRFTEKKFRAVAKAATYVYLAAMGVTVLTAGARGTGVSVPNAFRTLSNLAPTASLVASLTSNACKFMSEPTLNELVTLAKSIVSKKQIAGYVTYMSLKNARR